MFDLQGKFYKDPIHQEINFDNEFAWLFKLTITPEFKRLASINQLGMSHELFPGATATRFVHSLGTYEVTRRFLTSIGLWRTQRKKAETVLAAALLHDLGHGPASHCFEEYMTDVSSNECSFHHETFSQKLILNPQGRITKILQENGVDPNQLAELLFVANQKNDTKMWMQQLVSSELDADRIDYLLRDSYYTGANYGIIDAQLLIKWAHLDRKTNKIFYNQKAVPLLENFLISRYHMYENVYLNAKSITLSWHIRVIFSILREYILQNKIKITDRIFNNTIRKIIVDHDLDAVNLNDYILLNDHYFYAFITSLMDCNDKFLSDFVNSYINGISMFKLIWFENEQKRDEAYQTYYAQFEKKYQDKLKFLLRKVDFKNVEIYSPKKDTQRIWVEKDAGKVCDLLELSPLISAVVNQKDKYQHGSYLIYSDVYLSTN